MATRTGKRAIHHHAPDSTVESATGLKQAERDVADATAVIRTHVEAVRRATETFEEDERAALAATANAARSRMMAAWEFDSIRAMSKVERMEIVRQTLIITTKTLYATDCGVIYDIGGWIIRIPRTKDVDDIQIRPRERRVASGHGLHPHVFWDGHVCWGNVKTRLSQALRNSEYDVALQYLIAILETVRGNRDNWKRETEILEDMGRTLVNGKRQRKRIRRREYNESW